MRYRAPRHPADNAIVVTTRNGKSHAMLRNVSLDGMCIAGLDDLRYGDRVYVALTGRGVTGRIVWSHNGLAGMRLDRSLDETEMCFLRKVPPPQGYWEQSGVGRSYTEL